MTRDSNVAKGAAWAAGKPFIGVNHLEGHLYANKIGAPDFQPPAVVSLVSGGNTLLVHMKGWGDYETLGATIDDAVGEAFDKVAKALGLGYPGGPVISREAAKGDPHAIPFPRAMMHSGDLRFSLSGLKTAVVTYINNERAAGRELNVPNICASFQQAVVDVQVKKAEMALEQTGARTFCLGGGVAAYTYSFTFTDRDLPTADRIDAEQDMVEALTDADARVDDLVDADSNQGIGYARDDVDGDSMMWMTLLDIIIVIMAFVFVVLTDATEVHQEMQYAVNKIKTNLTENFDPILFGL